EAVLLIARTTMPEGVGHEVVAGLPGGLPALGGGAAIAAHIKGTEADAVFPGIDLAGQGDAGVGGARIAVAIGQGEARLSLAGPLCGGRQRHQQQGAGKRDAAERTGHLHERSPVRVFTSQWYAVTSLHRPDLPWSACRSSRNLLADRSCGARCRPATAR